MPEKRTNTTTYFCEAEVAEGLEEIAANEINRVYGTSKAKLHRGAVQFNYQGSLRDLHKLKTIISIYILKIFDISRPKALLGHQNFHSLLDTINAIRQSSDTIYQSLAISAAGSDSSVMMRLKQELAAHLNLDVGDDTGVGDLFIRIRKNREIWEVLIRITPRPLATRDWRVCNMEGALNGSVAHAMLSLLPVKHNETLLNLGFGSGTLMIEALSQYSELNILGCDNNTQALECAILNIAAASYSEHMDLILADMCQLPLGKQDIDFICADLPFGQLVGSHKENAELYPKVLNEAARVIKNAGVFVLITHEIKLMEKVLSQSNVWQVEKALKIVLRGLHPRIYLLRKI